MKNRNIPYGYCYIGGEITIQPQESAIINDICQFYLSGRSMLQIAEWLNKNRIAYMPGVFGWNKVRVKRILEDDAI